MTSHENKELFVILVLEIIRIYLLDFLTYNCKGTGKVEKKERNGTEQDVDRTTGA